MLWALSLAGAVHAAVPLGALSLEDDDGGCISEGETAQWTWGAITGGSGAAFTGTNGWALALGGGYLNDTRDTLTCPAIDLSGAARPVLEFAQWYDLQAGDSAWIEVDGRAGWTAVTPVYASAGAWSGASSGWVETAVDLTGLGSPLAVRWVFEADTAGVGGGWFVDDVAYWDGDPIAPSIESVEVLEDTEAILEDRVVHATVREDVALQSVELRYVCDGGETVSVPMTGADEAWEGVIPGQVTDTTVAYQVWASDGENEAVSVETSFRYYLAAPLDLRLDAERPVGQTVPLVWTAPESVQEVTGYRLYRDGVQIDEVATTSADAAVTGGLDTFTVRATYSLGEGDASESLEILGAVPSVTDLTPAEGWPGDHMRSVLTGQYLLLTDGEVEVTLGEGILVALTVYDVDCAELDLQIDSEAEPGERALVVRSPSGEVTVADAFTVLDGEDRPRLLGDALTARQGEQITLELHYLGEMATTSPTVDLGPDVVIDNAAAAAGVVTVTCTISGNAPLGDRDVVVDDGVRYFEGSTFTVLNGTTQATGCGVGVGGGWKAMLLALAWMGTRARGGGRRDS